MCYKDEVQKKNAKKLQKKFEEDNVPKFIRDYLEDIESKDGALKYWSVLKDFLLWLIKEKIIEKESVSGIIIVDFNQLYPQHISKYLRQKEENGISPTTLVTRKNIIRSFLSNVGFYKESTIGDIKEFFKRVKYKGISSNNNLIRKFPSETQLKNMEEKIMKKKGRELMEEMKLNVSGMVCGGCEKRVVNALSTIDGVKEVMADHTNGTVLVKADQEIDKDMVKEKIEDLGFEVEEK